MESATIDGMQDYDEAENLAATIRIGSLSLELEELRSNVVGAKLGQEAICYQLKGRRYRIWHCGSFYDRSLLSAWSGFCTGAVPVCSSGTGSAVCI